MYLESQLREAWWQVAKSFCARSGPLVRTIEDIEPTALQTSWLICAQSLQTLFANHYGYESVAARFSVPKDYEVFMQLIGGGWKWPFSLEWVLFDAQTVTTATENNFRLFVSEVEEDEPPMDSGFWLSIGCWSDKHEYLLCCDRNHSHYGVVLDGHDSHPWLNGVEFGGCYLMAKSFSEWLRLHSSS
ncbi:MULTISPECIES: SMI1/KNR4 family protein [Nostoc]|uniref:SMI1/KNR4 family protein n=1 Tax=Nostoc paludosum FACHB-159 TaxID=2692908 RepID=A0ABR8KLU6_9NOSO|nr:MULTISPECIES: SMI1/KNR4 family protein [Nostoc]MBD2683388.1 SMI1/KNR4 family protein [Nostoc sp. FACHB-857]MBD2739706.1 SMI1/KNR4 family protein [Nostoc paludosum FACHB-159]